MDFKELIIMGEGLKLLKDVIIQQNTRFEELDELKRSIIGPVKDMVKAMIAVERGGDNIIIDGRELSGIEIIMLKAQLQEAKIEAQKVVVDDSIRKHATTMVDIITMTDLELGTPLISDILLDIIDEVLVLQELIGTKPDVIEVGEIIINALKENSSRQYTGGYFGKANTTT